MAKFLDRLSRALQVNKATPVVKPVFGVGAVIDRHYRLDAEIGRGGMGIVYRGYDILHERDVAIKAINPETANALTIPQFLREAEIMQSLDNPHIIAVYEVGRVSTDSGDGLPFIVMELTQGTSLEDVHSFTYVQIVEIGKQICETLDYIHRQGFVYRDLKPGNVILERRGFQSFVKLLDFGLARPRGEAYLPHESNLAGTTFYLAPELINGQPADIGSDLYALGVLLYEMITGRVPFFNIDEQNILSQHLNEAATPPSQSRSDMPPALEVIVLRLLEKNPKDRFASAQGVLDALNQVVFASGRETKGNLPKVNYVGHEGKIEKVIQSLAVNQLVTLLGDEEELALAAASQLTSQFTDGVWLISLDSVQEPSMVLQTVVSILGVTEKPNRPLAVTLIEAMHEKNLLLLVSHCGHLVGACAQFAMAVLSACPAVRILAVSRLPLNIPPEYVLQQDTTSK
ncbi:MAG: protein kinase [Anaerolineales bacterium]